MIPPDSHTQTQTQSHQPFVHQPPCQPQQQQQEQQVLIQLPIHKSFPSQLIHYNSLPYTFTVSGQQQFYFPLQRELSSAANISTNKSTSAQLTSYSPISPDHTPPNVSDPQFYSPSSLCVLSSSPSYLTQPTILDTNTQKMSYQFPVTILMNYGNHFPQQQFQQQLSPHPQQQQQQQQSQLSPRESKMKANKVAKINRRKSRNTENLVSKFPTKLKSKKTKRNHNLIPNNSIYYPIYRPSANDGLSFYDTEFLNKFIYPKIEIKKYSTSALDPQRSYITAYEYPINNHWVIWDYETGWVHLTGIWKASLNVEEANVSPSHMKADIVKLLESTPKEYQHYIKRIRGGFLKIQGTWLPYKLCKILARRFCYHIRYSLIPLFGADFPNSCLKPNARGFGELKLDDLHNFGESALPLPIPPPPTSHQQQSIPHTNSGNSNYVAKSNQLEPPAPITNAKALPPVGVLLPGQQSQQTSPLMQYNSSSFPFNCNVTTTSDGNYNAPITPPKRHYSSSSSISSISSSVFSGERITPISNGYLTSEIPSFNEMIDIVNASKCLQTLSKDSSSPRNMKNENKVYGSENGGISAILLAAGLSGVSNNHREAVSRSSPRDSNVKAGMTINDLLT